MVVCTVVQGFFEDLQLQQCFLLLVTIIKFLLNVEKVQTGSHSGTRPPQGWHDSTTRGWPGPDLPRLAGARSLPGWLGLDLFRAGWDSTAQGMAGTRPPGPAGTRPPRGWQELDLFRTRPVQGCNRKTSALGLGRLPG